MAFKDEFGTIPHDLPPDTSKKHRDALRIPIVIAEGEVSLVSGTVNIMVRQESPLMPDYYSRAKIPDISHNFR